jgi:hypothetical protein
VSYRSKAASFDTKGKDVTITVGSQRKDNLSPPLGAVVIRIDRASVLGNPFDMGNDERLRPAIVEAHSAWLDALLANLALDAVQLAISMAEQLGLKLATAWKRPSGWVMIRELYRIGRIAKTQEVWILCWCSPEACHGDAYKAVIESGLVESAHSKL